MNTNEPVSQPKSGSECETCFYEAGVLVGREQCFFLSADQDGKCRNWTLGTARTVWLSVPPNQKEMTNDRSCK